MRLMVPATLLGVVLFSTSACSALQHSEPAAPVPTGLRHSLSGNVSGLHAGPIALARLTVVTGSDSGAQVITDGAGNYSFSSLSGGRVTMTIEAAGFERATPIVDLTRDLSVDFALRRLGQ